MDLYRSFFKKMCRALRLPIIVLIYGYQLMMSPFLGTRCRFYPSCSQYAIESIKYHGVLAGLWLVTKRLLKCHPGSAGGYDPTPKKQGLHQ